MWFEEIEIGGKHNLGEYTFAADKMIAFAQKYDPQIFHIDPEAAKQSIFGGLIASGWMTVAVWMKLMTAKVTPESSGASVSPGFEDLRWYKPVRPGTTLTYSTEVVEKRELKSRPRFGLVLNRNEARDKDGALYMSIVTKVLREKRNHSMTGKMIPMKMADGKTIGVYHVEPNGARRGGLVLIQEIFGITDHIKACCEGYAADGYEVLAPALFDREAPGFVSGYTPEEMQKGAALAYGSPLEQRVADAQSCIEALKGPVFLTGYCFGGSVTWAAACRCKGIAAASSYYGKLVPELANETPKCPTICHFGTQDTSIPMDGVEKLIAAHPEVPVYIYEAGHGFNSSRPTHHNEVAAKLARQRTLELFRANGG